MKTVVVVLLVSMCAAGCGCTTVDPGYVGIKVSLGSVEGPALKEGFHWVSVVADVTQMTTRTQTYTMAGAGAEGQADGAVNVLARDQLAVQMEVSVMFHLHPDHAIKVYRIFGEDYADTIVHPLVRTAVRDAASEFRAVELVDDRARLQDRMEALVLKSLTGMLRGRRIAERAIVVDNILVRNIDLPNTLEEAIANVQKQAQQTAQRQQALLTARAESERQKTEAEGSATARLIAARAEAESNRILAASLSGEVLRLRQINVMRDLLSNQNTRLIIVPSGGNTTLMLPATVTP